MLVSDILNQKGYDVVTIEDGAPMREATARLAAENIGAVIVMSALDRVCGVLSERDIVRALSAQGAATLDAPITEHMSKDVITCTSYETVDRLMAIMTRERIRHVPVVEEGELVGIVSIGDVVKRRIEETENEAAMLKEYIAATV